MPKYFVRYVVAGEEFSVEVGGDDFVAAEQDLKDRHPGARMRIIEATEISSTGDEEPVASGLEGDPVTDENLDTSGSETTEESEETEAPAKAKKLAEWKSFEPAEKAEFLLAHNTIPDSGWVGEDTPPRNKGEKRDAYIRRVLLGEEPVVEETPEA